MPKTVIIAGASGKIGQHTARAFHAAGWKVHRYNRARGDLAAQARGADVIVNGMNPPNYHDWPRLIPQITAQVIDAARASGARILVPGNVYQYGTQPAPWDASTPHKPASRKGQIRKEMEQAYRAAGVRLLNLRAGNFIDPDRNGCVMSLIHLTGIAKGKVTAMGDPDIAQSYAYLPDWARAAVALCDLPAGSLPPYADIPFAGHTFNARALARELGDHLGRPVTIRQFPWWMMRAASPFWELARELLDQRYLWDHPHSLSGDELARLLPDFTPTPIAQVMRAALPADIHPHQRMTAHA